MKSEPSTNPASCTFNLLVLGLLVFAGSFHAMPAAAASDDTNAVRLTIELRDGSRVVGQGVDKTLPFQSVLLGKLELAVKDIRSIECLTTNTAKLTITGGDVLMVSFAKSELRVLTGFGKVELPVNSVRRLTVSVLRAAGKPIDGLVALWSAEGNADDSVGNRHGQLLNQAGYAPGKVGQAFAFHSLRDQLLAPATDLPTGTSDRTIDCWIYLDSFNNDAEECIAGYGVGGPGQIFSLSVCHGHRLAFTQWGDSFDGSELEANRWYNVAVTSAGTGPIKLYVDGVNVATGTLNFSTPAGGQFWIGKINSPYTQAQFYGLIDEVAVYNRALSDDEIKSLAEDAPAKPAPAR